MVAIIGLMYPPPLSPRERDSLTDDDRVKVDAWRFRLNGYAPDEKDFVRKTEGA